MKKKDNLKFSILMPVYNGAKVISSTLRSILSQSFDNFELIIVDNFSNDNTREIANEYGAIFYSIGPERCTQVNFGVSKAKGKSIVVCTLPLTLIVAYKFLLFLDTTLEYIKCGMN